MPLGEQLLGRRRSLGLLQKEAARAIGVSLSTFRNWERGRAEVREEHYPALIRFLGYDPNPARSLPERVRSARLREGLSQKALALRLGLDPSTVRAWEAGEVALRHGRVRQLLLEYVGAVERHTEV